MAPPLAVRITDDLRLAGALLAAGEWPEREQAARPYQPHRAAEAARRHFAPYRSHPAVQAANDMGGGVRRLYAAAAAGAWPAGLAVHLPDFVAAAQPDDLWAVTRPAWSQAEADLCAVVERVNLPGFLQDVFGLPAPALVVYPNLLYPGREVLAFEAAEELVVCQPPPAAWGASPPWRYSERPDEVLAALATAAAECLFERRLPPAQAALRAHAPTFALAAAVLFLRRAVDGAASNQFLVMEKKARRLPQLPDVVAALEAALEAGHEGLGEYVADLAVVLAGS